MAVRFLVFLFLTPVYVPRVTVWLGPFEVSVGDMPSVLFPSLNVAALRLFHVLGGAEGHSFYCFTAMFLHLVFTVAPKEPL